MPDLGVLRGQGALGPGTLPQGTNPLANYPQARQPNEGFRDFVDRSGSPAAMMPALMQALPPAAGAFALGMMPTPAGGQSKPSEETRKLQQFLKDRGYFKWAVDGVGGEKKTEAARERYEADQRAIKQQEIETLRAQGQLEESKRQAEAEANRASERAAGEKRTQEMDKNVGPVSRFMRDYSEPLGYGLGVLGGMATRGAVVAAVECTGSRSSGPRRGCD